MKKKGGLITMIVVVLIVALLFGAYQWFRFPAAFRNLSDESLSAEQVNELKEELKAKEDKNVLVTYFSYSGTTRGVAETLSNQIGADLFEIAPKEDYSSLYPQSNMEIRRGKRPELSSEVGNMEEYDIIFIGYPVWFHATPAPINSFLESYDLTGKLIIPFCTSGGSDIDETMPTFLDSCEDLAVYGERRISGSSQIGSWLTELDLNLGNGN
ncbi:MAG: flavodoxin [Eubacteriales bacterium]|nr:flavodoxin [Eubacteriales bacterium]